MTAYVSAFQQLTPVLGLTVKVKITRPLGGETELLLTDRGFGKPYRDDVIFYLIQYFEILIDSIISLVKI